MPSFLVGILSMPAGRRAPFSAACLLTNSERIMLPAVGSRISLVKYLLSSRMAVSNGTIEPS